MIKYVRPREDSMKVKNHDALADLGRLLRHSPTNEITVGLDVDGTLAKTYEPLLHELNKRNHTSYTTEDIAEQNMAKTWSQSSHSDFMKLYNELWTQRRDVIMPTVEPSLMREFTSKFSITIVTYRPTEHLPCLTDWLYKNYRGIGFTIRITKTPEAKLDGRLDILYDDGNPVADAVVRLGNASRTKLFLIEQPWNRGRGYEDAKGIISVPDLSTGMKTLLRISESNQFKMFQPV